MAQETFEQLAKRYAEEIHAAAFQDQLARVVAETLAKGKRTPVVRNTVAALGKIEEDLRAKVYVDSQQPLTDDDKESIYKAIAERLGLGRHDKLKELIKEASIDNALVVIQDAQDIIDKIKK